MAIKTMILCVLKYQACQSYATTISGQSSDFNTSTFRAIENKNNCDKVSIEGGDVLIGRDDLLLIGISNRTTSQGIDVIIEKLKERKMNKPS